MAAASRRGGERRLTSTHASSSRGAGSGLHGMGAAAAASELIVRSAAARPGFPVPSRPGKGGGQRRRRAGRRGGRGKSRAGAEPAVPERPAHAPGRAARSGAAGPGRASRQQTSAGLESRPPGSGSRARPDCLCHLLSGKGYTSLFPASSTGMPGVWNCPLEVIQCKPLPSWGYLEQGMQEYIQVRLEWLRRGRPSSLPEQPVPILNLHKFFLVLM